MESKGSTNIQVAVRMRPLITTEKMEKLRAQWGSQNNLIYQIDDSGHRQQIGEVYTFDHIFGTDKTNLDIYNDIVKDFVLSSLSGLNSTIFAYGQTSSGKTYTMLGDKNSMGIMPLAIENIFEMVRNNKHRKYLLRVSYMEIYNEKINDLLDPSNKDVKIREFFPATIGLQNIKEELVTNKEQMYECLKTGNLNRHISATKANDRSSRSHTIFKIVIESTETGDLSGCIQISNLNLVDLAGSERVAQTKATGMRLKEGGHINKSLSALSLVIKQLSDGKEFVNFRDSKLTRLLQDSLGGNSKTLIIATITLASVEDTNSTLAFAQRAKTVKNKPRVNEILTEADVHKRNAALNAELQKKLKEQMMMNQHFQQTEEEYFRKITNLQQQVKMLEDFQGARTPDRSIPKRRHTIGFSTKKKLFSRLPMDDFEKSSHDVADVTLFEDLLKRDPPSTGSKLNTIREEDPITLNKLSTPENILRIRLSSLEEEYNELLSFTRNENNIFDETAKKADELEQELKLAQKKLLEFENQRNENDFETRELELETKIKYLEEELSRRFDNTDTIVEMMDELIRLQEILKNSAVFDGPECLRGDSVLQTIKKFNVKAKTSKDIIETEILKQINNFDNGSQDDINFSSELTSFNDLLNQLSLFESDVPADVVDNMKKETVEDFKVLIKIYESFLRKNELIRNCRENIKILEETHNNCILLKEELDDKVKENDKLLQEIDKLEVLIKTMRDDTDTLNGLLNEKNNKISEVEKNYALRMQENEELRQNFLITCSENTSLKDELNKAKKDFLDGQTNIDKFTKKCAILEDEKRQLQQRITTIEEENECLVKEVAQINVEMNQLKMPLKTMTDDLDVLNRMLNEKDNKILEVEKNCTLLLQENEELKQKSLTTCSENISLKNELNTLKNNFLDSKEMVNNFTKNCAILEDEKRQLQQRIADIVKEKECLVKDVDRINLEMNQVKMPLKTITDDVDMLNRMLNEKDKKILEIEKNYALLIQESEELKQKSFSTCSENRSLKNELNTLKIDFLNNQEIVDKATKDRAILEDEKLKLQQQITNCDKEKECLAKEVDRIKHVINSQNQEIHDFTLAVMEKNKVITEMKNNYTKLEQEQEKLQKEICIIRDHNQSLEGEIQKMKIDNESYSIKIKNQHSEALTVKLEEKEKIIQETETRNNALMLEIRELKRKFEDALLESEGLKEEIQNKNSSLTKFESDGVSLKQKVEKLTQANSEKDKIIREIHNSKRKLTSEIQNLREKYRTSDLHNQDLKTEIANLKNNDKIVLETQEKCKHLELEKEFVAQKLNKMLLVKEELTNEIENLKKTVQDRQHVIISDEIKLNQSELRVQKYKQLLEIAHAEINDLKEALSDKEKLKCEISGYRCQLSVSNSKLQECSKLNQDLTLKLKELQMQPSDCNNHNCKNDEDQEGQFKMSNLCCKKRLEDILCTIIEQVIGEQKTLLLNRPSQDRRDGFKNVIRSLKSANTVLKNQLHLLRNQKECDLKEISDNILKSRSSFHEYVNLEKFYLQKQIDELNSTNEQYLEEIILIKDGKTCINMTDCFQCKLLQSEVARLRELPVTQEKMLNSLKDKNKMLEKENYDRVKQVIDLQEKIYKEQDRKVEVKYTSCLEFYRENTKMQQKEIESLKQELEPFRKARDNKQSVEVQCNLIPEQTQLQIKYNMIKRLCIQRQEEISVLTMENSHLKNLNKKSAVDKTASVQCDILQKNII